MLLIKMRIYFLTCVCLEQLWNVEHDNLTRLNFWCLERFILIMHGEKDDDNPAKREQREEKTWKIRN